MGAWRGRVVCSLVALSVAGGLAAAPPAAPIAVSPGGPASFLVAGSTCPTFSWAVAGAATPHELVVHEVLGADASDMAEQPALEATLPAGATSWTPPLDGCLTPDRAYAWVVRAADPKGGSAWSEPRLFRTPAAPTAAELAELVGRLQAAAPAVVAPPPPTAIHVQGPGAASATTGAPPPAGAHLPSDLVVEGDYRYTSGKARHVFIPGSTFLTTFDDAPDVYRRINEGYGYVHSGSPPLSVNLQTAIHLPAGARVTTFDFFATDLSTTASASVELRLRRFDSFAGGWDEMVSTLLVSTGVGSQGTCTWCAYPFSFAAPLPPPIQAGETLFVVVTWKPTAVGNDLRFQGVRLGYLVDKAD